MSGGDFRGTLEAVDRIVNRGGDADSVLRAIVDVLHNRHGVRAEIFLVEEGDLVLGPAAGTARGDDRAAFPVHFRGDRVAELRLDTQPDAEEARALERIAVLISPYCLVAWDTGGNPWTP